MTSERVSLSLHLNNGAKSAVSFPRPHILSSSYLALSLGCRRLRIRTSSSPGFTGCTLVSISHGGRGNAHHSTLFLSVSGQDTSGVYIYTSRHTSTNADRRI